MSAGVLGLVLAAAFAHAGWNFLAKGAQGGAAFVWLSMVIATVAYLPVLGARWPWTPASWAGRPSG